MFRFTEKCRRYCKTVTERDNNKLPTTASKGTLNFGQLFHNSKVPTEPAIQPFTVPLKITTVDSQVIQLLERISLVDLDGKEALATLKSSIQFADNIVHLNTTGILALYTVQETQHLELRADIVTDGNCREQVLRNAKVVDEHYFVSPPGNIPLEQGEKLYQNPLGDWSTTTNH